MERQLTPAADAMTPPAPETVAQANHDEAMQIATDLRADGRARYDVIDQLRAYGLDEMMSERMIDEVDLIAGVLGRAHPIDIRPEVRQRIDAEAVLLPASNYRPGARHQAQAKNRDADTTEQIMENRAASSARQLIGDGKNEVEVTQYLESLGCHHDHALAVARHTAEEIRVEQIEAHAAKVADARSRIVLFAGVLLLAASATAVYFWVLG